MKILLAALSLSFFALAQEVTLTLSDGLGGWAEVSLPFRLRPTIARDVKFLGPELAQALWGDLALGEVRYAMVLGIMPDGAVALWVDENRDGAIEESEALPGLRGQDFFIWQAEFTAMPQGGEPYPYPLKVIWPAGRGYVFLVGGAPRSGQIAIDGQTVAFSIVDGDLDGVYGTKDDFYVVDVDRDGKLHGEPDSHERFAIEEPFTVGEKSFRLAAIDPAGGWIRLAPTPYTPPKLPLIPGHPAPNFTVFSFPDGKPLSLSNFRGKVVLLDFWATWCGPCMQELPNVKSLYERYREQGFEIVGISLDTKEQELRQLLLEEGISWPQYFDGRGWENEVALLYRIQAIPATYLIDRHGIIRYRDLRGKELEKAVAELISEEIEKELPPSAVQPSKPILEMALPKEIGILPGGGAELLVRLTNTSPYEAEEVRLEPIELPAGIAADPAELVQIPPFGERTASLLFSAEDEAQAGPVRIRLRYNYCIGESCFQIITEAMTMLAVGEAPVQVRRPTNPWWLLLLLGVGIVAAWFIWGKGLSGLALFIGALAVVAVAVGVFLDQNHQARLIASVLCTSCVGIEEGPMEAPVLSEAAKEKLSKLKRPVHLILFHAPWCHSCPYAISLAEQFAQANPLISLELVDAEENPKKATAAGVVSFGHLVVPAILCRESGKTVFGIADLEFRLLELILEVAR